MSPAEFVLARFAEDDARADRKALRPWPFGWTKTAVWSLHWTLAIWRQWVLEDEVVARKFARRYADHPDYREEWRP